MTDTTNPTLSAVPYRQITVPSGDCYQLAAQYLGDWTQVDRIMAANPQLNGDPWFTGVQTLNIPSVNPGAGTGGIIGG